MKKERFLTIILFSVLTCMSCTGKKIELVSCQRDIIGEKIAELQREKKSIESNLPKEVEAVLREISEDSSIKAVKFVNNPVDNTTILICKIVSPVKPYDFKVSWNSFEVKSENHEGLFFKTERTKNGLFVYYIGVDCQKTTSIIRKSAKIKNDQLEYLPFTLTASNGIISNPGSEEIILDIYPENKDYYYSK